MSVVEPIGEDIQFFDGEYQLGGYQNQFAIGFHNQVLTWPTFGASSDNQASIAEKRFSTTGNIVFKTGFCFSKVTSINDSIELESKGIEGSTGSESSFKIRVQKNAKNEAIIQSWLGSRLIAVLTPNEGMPLLLGKPTHYLEVKTHTVKSGNAKDANKSIEVEFKYMPFKPFEYSGTVSFTPAV